MFDLGDSLLRGVALGGWRHPDNVSGFSDRVNYHEPLQPVWSGTYSPTPALAWTLRATRTCCSGVACPEYSANCLPPNSHQTSFRIPIPPLNAWAPGWTWCQFWWLSHQATLCHFAMTSGDTSGGSTLCSSPGILTGTVVVVVVGEP